MTKAEIEQARKQMKESIADRYKRQVEKKEKEKELNWKSSGKSLPKGSFENKRKIDLRKGK